MKKGLLVMSVMTLMSCHGILDDIYDNPDDDGGVGENTLVVDASSWTDWWYVDFSKVKNGGVDDATGLQQGVAKVSIPLDAKGDVLEAEPVEGVSGIYTRWYDVFGEGLSRNEFRSFYPTEPQTDVDDWDIAVHRDNVRTNGGAVYETQLTSMDDLPASSESFADAAFVEDEWNATDVWTVQDRMLQGLIGSQGIKLNPVLSSWLSVSIPPIPPSFTHNNHVFVVRFKDGTYAALQLADYQSTKGVKCYLTIKYIYPY